MTTTFCPASLVDTAPSPHLVAERLNDGSATPRLSTAAALGLPTMPPLPEPGDPLAPLRGRSIPMLALHDRIRRIATTDATVLISGETGTGKELVARAVHGLGSRRAGAFVALNCGAVSGSLVESELFGHERGSFTGANLRRNGVFSQAHQGTLFLEEFTEMALDLQVRLLRVLETGTFQRIGGEETLQVDVRILAATHRDLSEQVSRGVFRQDLLYRLNTATVVVPPLRERTEDIEPLARHFLDEASRAIGTSARDFSLEALARLRAYAWPGNVRELRNVIERAVLVADGGAIGPDDLGDRVAASGASSSRIDSQPGAMAAAIGAVAPTGEHLDFRDRIRAIETDLILDALKKANGNQTEAARILRMPLRTLVHKLKAYGLRSE